MLLCCAEESIEIVNGWCIIIISFIITPSMAPSSPTPLLSRLAHSPSLTIIFLHITSSPSFFPFPHRQSHSQNSFNFPIKIEIIMVNFSSKNDIFPILNSSIHISWPFIHYSSSRRESHWSHWILPAYCPHIYHWWHQTTYNEEYCYFYGYYCTLTIFSRG